MEQDENVTKIENIYKESLSLELFLVTRMKVWYSLKSFKKLEYFSKD